MRKMYCFIGKKWLVGILAAGVLIACGCGGTEGSGRLDWKSELNKVQAAEGEQEDGANQVSEGEEQMDVIQASEEIFVYIQEFDGRSMVFDEVEWVTFPSERAEELGLEDGGSGFEVYNEKENPQRFELSADCGCTVLDWTENFVETEVPPEELVNLLIEREAPNIPYILTIENGQITQIQEKYVP